jgi:hypothetical protein
MLRSPMDSAKPAGTHSPIAKSAFLSDMQMAHCCLHRPHHNTNNAANTDRAKVTLLGGTYDFDMAKAHLAAGINKGVGTIDSRDWLIGISVPFGASSVFASYIRKDDRSAANRDASQAAIGYSYAMSKRTNLYASYSASASTMAPPIRQAIPAMLMPGISALPLASATHSDFLPPQPV